MSVTRRTIVGALPPGLAALPVAGEAARSQSFGAAAIRPATPRVEWLDAAAVDTLRPRFTWTLEGAPGARALRQSAFRLVVASSPEFAAAGRGEVWDSGRIAVADLRVQPPADLPLTSQRVWWWSLKVWDGQGRASPWMVPARFLTGLTTPEDWRARWIATEPDHPIEVAVSRPPKVAPVEPKPLPIFRRAFELSAAPRRAVVSVCGLGQYELTVNGAPVTASLLNPGWTDYRKTVLYNTFDVTGLLHGGENVLGVMLGEGMYDVQEVAGRYKKFRGTFGQPKLILRLRIEHATGAETVVVSDGRWRTTEGPITFSSIYGGEDYDARREPAGWRTPGFHDGDWREVLEVSAPPGRLTAQGTAPIVVAQTLAPVKVSEPKPGVFVYDMGLNAASRPALTLRAPAGTQVRLYPAEVLGEDGLVNQRSIGGRPGVAVYYQYTAAGSGDEVWRPRFSYCGCRYLQVEGAAPADRAAAAVVALVNEAIHADVAIPGDFDCARPLLVATHKLIRQAALNNTVSVFTDCPHREKLGWLEQDHLNAATLLFNEDAVTIFEKTIADISDAQLPNGQVPEIAPEYVRFLGPDSIYRDSPEWGSTVVLGAWATYRFYGDRAILQRNYPAMRRYADYLESRRGPDGIIAYGLGDWLDIGPKRQVGVSQLTTLGVTATATYYEMLDALMRIAAILGRPAREAQDYRRRAAGVRAAFNARFFHPTADSYDTGSQTALAMPLALGMVPPGRAMGVMANLVADIHAHSDHTTAGDIGFHYVVRALMDGGRSDVLLALLSRTDPPSYGGQILAGATALTENWNPAWGGSQDHFMLGHAEQWLFQGLGGVKVDFASGGPPISIAPQTPAGLESAGVLYRSVLGPIRTHWRREGARLRLEADIPPGALASVVMPGSPAGVREGTRAARGALGVLNVAEAGGATSLVVGSGRYVFTAG